ncbi:MAG: O-antigen ligase family protein [Patescibacteria group bacterium]|jgi:hypothetical protein
MKITKAHYFTLLITVFAFLLPWQTRYIFGAAPIGNLVGEYGIMSVYATELLLVVGLAVGYTWLGFPKLRQENRPPAIRALILIGAALVSVLFSTRLSLSLAQFIHVGGALVFFLALLDPRVELKKVLLGLASGLVLPLILGAIQVLTGYSASSSIFGLATRNADHLGDSVISLADGSRMLRAYGSFSHPNVFGGYLAVGTVAAGTLWYHARSLRYRYAYAALAIILLLGLFLTASRSAALGLALGTGLSLLVVRMKSVAAARIAVIPIAVFVIGGALGLTIFAPGVAADTRGGGVNETRSIEERAAQYVEFGNVEKKSSPLQVLVGHGVGTYTFEVAKIFPGRDVFAYQPVHSMPLLVFFDVGIIGCILIIVWQTTIDKMNFARFPKRDAVSAFAMGNVVLVILFFDHYIWSSWSGLALIAFVMALTVRMGEPEHTDVS